MDSGVLTGFMSPIRPKEIVSPSTKSDELFLSWLSDRKTKEFILQLANHTDGDTQLAGLSGTKKHAAASNKKIERSLLHQPVHVSPPLYSLSSNKIPLSLLRRASASSEPQQQGMNGDGNNGSPSNEGVDGSAKSVNNKKSPRPKEASKVEGQAQEAPETASDGGSKASSVVPQLALGPLSTPAPVEVVPKPGYEDLEGVFAHYQTLPAATGLDELVEDLLAFFALPRSLFYPLKYKLLLSTSPVGLLLQQHLSLKDFSLLPIHQVLANSKADLVSKIFALIRDDSTRDYLVPSDWIVLLLGLLDEHPGLAIIKGEIEYQERYIEAVITRLHFSAAQRTRTQITLREFRNANIAASISQLDALIDITRQPRYFDYMSYFVIYSKFTSLDQDKDWLISKDELLTYNHHALTTRIMDRAFQYARFLPRPTNISSSSASGRRNSHHQHSHSDYITHASAKSTHGASHEGGLAVPQARSVSGTIGRSSAASLTAGVPPLNDGKASTVANLRVSPRHSKTPEPFSSTGVAFSFAPSNRFSFMDFAWFLLSEEDKTSPASIDLWFDCLDRDEDGYWSPQDLFAFYEEQLFKMEFSVLDVVPFEDCLVQIIDMVKPKNMERISRTEVKKSGFASTIFDLLFNLKKFVNRDRQAALDGVGFEPLPIATWEQFANNEYLIALGETPYGDESDEWDDENLDIWVEVATEGVGTDSDANNSSANPASTGTPRDVTVQVY